MKSENYVTLATLCQGSAMELFARELERALENVADWNTPAKKLRRIRLTVSLKPDEDRKRCDVDVRCEAILPSANPAQAEFFIGKKSGRWVAVEYDPKQMGLFEQDAPAEFPSAAGERED